MLAWEVVKENNECYWLWIIDRESSELEAEARLMSSEATFIDGTDLQLGEEGEGGMKRGAIFQKWKRKVMRGNDRSWLSTVIDQERWHVRSRSDSYEL